MKKDPEEDRMAGSRRNCTAPDLVVEEGWLAHIRDSLLEVEAPRSRKVGHMQAERAGPLRPREVTRSRDEP